MKLVAKGTRKIFIILGTRPEALKLAPIIRALSNNAHEFSQKVCATGQHREMLSQALSFLEIVIGIGK